MRALHVASFNGNIGDKMNHIGFWNMFKKYVYNDVNITELEIREFYQSWGIRKFDKNFVDYANTFDFVVIGGGNFFDIKWDYSRTGTTIDIPVELLELITKPIIFNALGVDIETTNITSNKNEKFKKFLEYICNRDNIIVSVRNDGSMDILKKNFGPNIIRKIQEIPDPAFFTSAENYQHYEIPVNKKIIAVNIARDQITKRWPDKEFEYKDFCSEFSIFINEIIQKNKNLHFVFIPHIPEDMVAINDILNNVNDYNCRRHVTIAPYINGSITPAEYIIDLYRKSEITIGMRYHSNICAISMGVPTIGIVTLDKHVTLYNKIEMSDRLLCVNKFPYTDKLICRVNTLLENKELYIKENYHVKKMLKHTFCEYLKRIKSVLFTNY